MNSPRRALVLGLDGASLDVIRPLAEAGRLPNLARLLAEGHGAPLPSTVPAMTFPAWSSFATGLGPGRHGLFDFTQKRPGAYAIRFTNASDRHGDSILARASRAGRRVLCLGLPATWPPEPVAGLLVPGFDAPVSAGSRAAAASDPALYRAIERRVGPWMRPDLDEAAHADGWHERAVDVLVERVARKTRFTREALRQLGRVDLAIVVFSESDTVAHHFWRDHDSASPRHDPGASAKRRGAVAAVYEALDAACGELREAFGADALCAAVSDHGSGGAARRVVHLNRHLADAGLLVRSGRGLTAALAGGARDAALRWLPPRVAEAVFRRARGAAARVESAARFGGHDWRQTVAFSEEANTQPGVWINLAGREAQGCVSATDFELARDDVIAALADWKLPGGEPVVARVRRREEVYEGPFVERAPDLVVELALEHGYALSLVPTPWDEPERASVYTLDDAELAGGRGRGMNGTHRPDGIWIASEALEVDGIAGVAPALCAALGIPWDDVGAAAPRPRAHSAAEEARVAARLRALGYLE